MHGVLEPRMFQGSMAMSCHSQNFPIHLVDAVDWNRIPRRTQLTTTLLPANIASSILLRADVDGNLSRSKNFALTSSVPLRGSDSHISTLPNTVGIIGGVSASSTLSFLQKLVDWSCRDAKENLPFIVCSDPILNRELSSHKRSNILQPSSGNNNSQFNPDLVVENLKQKRLFLEKSGVCCIAMPCHIPHIWLENITKDCSVPFLHIGECVAKEIEEANLSPVEAGSIARVGVITTDANLTTSYYQDKLQSQGFEVLFLDKATMEHTVIPAVNAFRRNDMEGARNLMRIAIQTLLVRAVSSIILASDDMSGLLPHDDPLLKKCIDPMDALVRSTVKWASEQ